MYTVYGKPGCIWCQRAVGMCEREGIEHAYKIIDEDLSKEDLIFLIGEYDSIPQITCTLPDGSVQLIGGYTELKLHLERRKL